MARRVQSQTTKTPAERGPGATFFYASEVVQILSLQEMDYAQLRRLLRLARGPRDQPTRKWARFTFEDLVAVRVAVRLAGGAEALNHGRHLQLAELERACASLRALGIPNPLLQVPLRREGSTIVAEIDGMAFRPATNQLALPDTTRRVARYLADVVPLRSTGRALRADVNAARKALVAHSKSPHRIRSGNGSLSW